MLRSERGLTYFDRIRNPRSRQRLAAAMVALLVVETALFAAVDLAVWPALAGLGVLVIAFGDGRGTAVLWGSPGTGKTSVVRALGASLGCPVEVVIGSLREPSDFAGLPVVVDSGVRMARRRPGRYGWPRPGTGCCSSTS